MKNAVLILCLLAISTYTFGQQVPAGNEQAVKDLMEKSKNQKKAAPGLLVCGVVLGTVGSIVASSNMLSDNGEGNFVAGLGLVAVGGIFVIGGISLYIASNNNQNKARELSVLAGYDRTSPYALGNHQPVYFPALKIRLRIP